MAKFLKHHDRNAYMDLSTNLRDAQDWNAGNLRTFEYPLEIAALAIEPVSGLLAIGTTRASPAGVLRLTCIFCTKERLLQSISLDDLVWRPN
jgi:hypothetical protein